MTLFCPGWATSNFKLSKDRLLALHFSEYVAKISERLERLNSASDSWCSESKNPWKFRNNSFTKSLEFVLARADTDELPVCVSWESRA